jgi:hypothetical protein
MSSTGSLLIRNLRTRKDYKKAVLAQDELLRIATANDANISAARKAGARGEIPPLTQQQDRDPTEIQADTAKQESDVIKNLQSLGFRFNEIQAIVGKLSPDQIFKINQTFPALRRDIERIYDVKLLTPSFFLDYLNKYFQELDKSKGMIQFSTKPSSEARFEVGVSVSDVKTIIPSREMLTEVVSLYRNLIEPQVSIFSNLQLNEAAAYGITIDNLSKAVPTEDFYSSITALDDRSRSEILNRLLEVSSRVPTRIDVVDFADAMKEGSLNAIETINTARNLFSSVDEKVIDELKSVKGAEAEEAPSSPMKVVGAVDLSVKKDWKAAGVRLKKQFITDLISRGEIPNNMDIRDMVREISIKNKNALDGVWNSWKEGIFSAPEALSETIGGIRFGTPPSRSKTISREPTPVAVVGKGIKIVKIGKGIELSDEPQYRKFGKYIINYKQLVNNDILTLKYANFCSIAGIKNTPVSDVFKDFLIDLLDSGKPNIRMYSQVPVEERKFFEKISIGAGVMDLLKIKKTVTDKDKEDLDRFNLIRGEYLAGNNSQTLIKELRRFTIQFMNDKKIGRGEGMNLLMELSV